MKRYRLVALIVVVVLAAALAFWLIGCERKVQVTTGERVVCAYGHDVTNSVRTIEVPADKASEYGVSTKSITCPDHLKAEQAYQAAQGDIAKADLKAAEAKLSQVVAIDPEFKRAKAQLAYIKSGKKPTPDTSGASSSDDDSASGNDGGSTNGDDDSGSTDEPSTPGDDGPASGPIASLSGWMPDSAQRLHCPEGLRRRVRHLARVLAEVGSRHHGARDCRGTVRRQFGGEGQSELERQAAVCLSGQVGEGEWQVRLSGNQG